MPWQRWLPAVWSCTLALLMLGPALGPGYVLSYDMVWVPQLTMRPDFLGLGTALPRAVPSDAVVAALDLVLPGMLLQKLVLVGGLVGGGCGAALLVPRASVAGRLVAISVYQWNPFVAERLVIGHWPVLLGYAVLPWVVLAARRWRASGRLPGALMVLLPLGCLSASAGLATAVVLLASTVSVKDLRRSVLAVVLLLAANAPWVVAGLLHATTATTDAAGVEAFALDSAGSVPGPVTALVLGGIWNTEAVLPSRTGVSGWLYLASVLFLALVGLRAWWLRERRHDALGLVACWAVGYALAVLTWAAPDALGWLATQVPGAGLLRDGARILALCAPLLAVAAAEGAAVLGRRVPAGVVPQVTAAGVLTLVPVLLLPDAALGLSGRLDAVDLPASYAEARSAVLADSDTRGDVLVLPLTSYRQPDWNGSRKVLDPVGRYLPRDVLAGDDLVVSGVVVPGEDPRVGAVERALGEATPSTRARRLADLGIGFVVLEKDAGITPPGVAGPVVVDTDDLSLVRLDDAAPTDTPAAWKAAMTAAWVAYAGMAAWGASGAFVLMLRRRGAVGPGLVARPRRD